MTVSDFPKGRKRPQSPRQALSFVALAVVAIAAIGIFGGSWYTVDEGQRGVVLRLGAVQKITAPGLHLKIPFIEEVHKVNVRVTALEWSGESAMEAYSKDQQPAHLTVTVSFRVPTDDENVKELYTSYRTIENYQSSVLIPRAMESIKTVFGQFNAVTAIQERARLNVEVEKAVQEVMSSPVMIEGVQIQDIKYSEACENSVEQRMQAQVEVERVQQNKAREQLQADIKVIQAKADAEAVTLRGQAEAAAIKARGDALRENPQLVTLVAAEKWNGVLPTTQVPGSAVPFIEVPVGRAQ